MGQSHPSAWSHAIKFELERALREIGGDGWGGGVCVWFFVSFCFDPVSFSDYMYSSDKYDLIFFNHFPPT